MKLAFAAVLAYLVVHGTMGATVIVGSDGGGPVQLYDSSANLTGTFGPVGGTVGALDGDGGLFIATPGATSSVVDEFGPSQNLLNSFTFTLPVALGPYASYITDMSWGDAGTLWISTYLGGIYHLAANGSVLSDFNTGATSPGVAFDGTDLFTTSGPSNPFVYEWTTSGTMIDTVDTGLPDTLGIGYDSTSKSLWIGGFDVLSEVDLSGNILQGFAIDGTHYGVDIGEPAVVSSVPEPSTWLLVLAGLAVSSVWKLRLKLRKVYRQILCVCLAVPTTQAAITINAFSPNLPSPQSVGTSIAFTVSASDTSAGALRYRFRVGPSGGALATLRDYSPVTSVTWTPSATDGSYEIEVSVLNRSTHLTLAKTISYIITPRAIGSSPVVNATGHPLVALYSSPACPSGSTERVRFKLPADVYWQSTPTLPCNGTTTMNFCIAGMRASSTYQLRQDVFTGPQVVTGPTLTFTTGAISISLSPVNAIVPLKTPSSLTEPISLFQGLDMQGYHSYAVDATLNVVWYAATSQSYLTRLVSGGGYLAPYGVTTDLASNGFREYDLAGNLVKETNVERMNDELAAMGMNPVTLFHHEIRELSNGDYLLLAQREVVSTVQGPPDDIAGDLILVLDSNLQLLWAWDTFQHLDVTRPATLGDTCQNGATCVLLNSSTAHDWTHGNSVQLTPDGNLLYSARNQDFVYKIDYQNGAGDGHVIWKLGKGGDFTWNTSVTYPWFSHQHDASYQDATTLTVFDDGNTRVQVEGGGNSRGEALTLDEVHMVVTPILIRDLGAYSSFLGSAQRLTNGNYAFENGAINGQANTQLSEWTASGTEVSNIHSSAENYRGYRLRDLYSSQK